MTCYHPLTAWKSRDPADWNNGKGKMVFSREKGLPSTETQLACGQCVGCRLDRARQWAVRCVHESKLHSQNCFLTLTYNDDNLPLNGSLNKRDIVLFLKRLRKKYGKGIRFFQCGEYGDLHFRPHHHVLLFGHDFPDKQLFSCSNDIRLYTSLELQALWPFGFCTVGDVTFDSACYVARYIMKKITGDKQDDYYKGKLPEFVTMSRRPGIGRDFYEKYRQDFYNYDTCVVKGDFVCRPPRYYDSLYDTYDPERFAELKRKRKASFSVRGKKEIEAERLETLEKIQRLKMEKLKRKIEKIN